jgi:mono/diheme cytochrome c family protein
MIPYKNQLSEGQINQIAAYVLTVLNNYENN